MYFIGSTCVDSINNLSIKLVEFAREFKFSAVLDSNSETTPSNYGLSKKYDLIAGFAKTEKQGRFINNFQDLGKIDSRSEDWYFGYLCYDLKNEIEDLKSENPDDLLWPDLFFFQPEILFTVSNKKISVYSSLADTSLNDILAQVNKLSDQEYSVDLPIMHPRLSKEDYLKKVRQLKDHIHRGDIYEVNFCMEFYNHSQIDPYKTFLSINKHTHAPFSTFFKFDKHFLLSASPERYIRKDAKVIISQPIKGTAPRGNSPAEDQKNKTYLETSLKERTENIMITDLVRNDLSKIAKRKSVRVEELCKIYAYPHVYQMVSTIKAEVEDPTMLDIIRATFPMGSMTGAPKIKAMQLIEEYETRKRGLYSGGVGYIGPGMNFDFNVVIRSLQYNSESQYLSYISGSAITDLADPENEYEECLLKAYAINTQIKRTEHA